MTRRFTIGNITYNNFVNAPMVISDIKFVEGDGIDGITNSFAAALWAIDFAI